MQRRSQEVRLGCHWRLQVKVGGAETKVYFWKTKLFIISRPLSNIFCSPTTLQQDDPVVVNTYFIVLINIRPVLYLMHSDSYYVYILYEGDDYYSSFVRFNSHFRSIKKTFLRPKTRGDVSRRQSWRWLEESHHLSSWCQGRRRFSEEIHLESKVLRSLSLADKE